jgi:hypothetical protein
VQNQGETGVDCGGPCAACASCNDGTQNQGETGVDCGGPCAACPTCSDGTQNQGETGVDCGGPCSPCETCSDNTQNQDETDVDCGGSVCGSCADGAGCEIDGDCTSGLCTLAVCVPMPSCSDGVLNQGETGLDCGGPCAACAALSLTVVRVGDGSAALSSASTAVFLEERDFVGALVNTIALPTAASGANQPFTLSGTATSEGNLSRSENGSYVLLAGYGVAPGTSSVSGTTAAAVNRVVARIDGAGAVDTSTRLDTAFSTGSVRSATSTDGMTLWVSGTGGSGVGGVHATTLGALGSTQVLAAPNNTRFSHVFAGQLYASASSNPFFSVFAVGTGTPTIAGQVATTPAGLPSASGPSPYSFAFFDLDPLVAGVDRLYIADDRSVASGGGIQKWTFDGATWTLAATFNGGLTAGARGLTGVASGGTVTLYATTSDTSLNKIVSFVDDGTPAPMATLLATAATNTIFRGIALTAR